MILVKPCHRKADYLNIVCNTYPLWEESDISLYSGDEFVGGFSYEEFELIYRTVKEFRNEQLDRLASTGYDGANDI